MDSKDKAYFEKYSTLWRAFQNLHPYPMPPVAIGQLMAYFDVSIEGEGEFQLEAVSPCTEGLCRCLCGKRIKNVYRIHLKRLDIAFGLGSECVKRFFPELSIAAYKRHESTLKQLFTETMKAFEIDTTNADKTIHQARAMDLLSPNQELRMSAGFPLTHREVQVLEDRINRHLRHEIRQDQQLARLATSNLIQGNKDYASEAMKKAVFQYFLARLKSGEVIKSLEALLEYPPEHLLKHKEQIDQEQGPVVADTNDKASIYLEALKFLLMRQEDLTPITRLRLLDIARSMGEAEDPLAILAQVTIQQELINMGNQLGLNLSFMDDSDV